MIYRGKWQERGEIFAYPQEPVWDATLSSETKCALRHTELFLKLLSGSPLIFSDACYLFTEKKLLCFIFKLWVIFYVMPLQLSWLNCLICYHLKTHNTFGFSIVILDEVKLEVTVILSHFS